MRVLIVDDHAELRALVAQALRRDQHEVLSAESLDAAQQLLAAHQTELVVLDLGLPDGSGEALCRSIRASGAGTMILVLTAQSAVASRVRCLDAGADDYLTKPFAVAELRARVRALARRTRADVGLSSSRDLPLLRRGDVVLDFAARRASVQGREAPITAREWAILGQLARAGGRVVSRQELLESIWSRADEAAAASLEVLVGRIRRKLGAELVRTSRGGGYALADG